MSGTGIRPGGGSEGWFMAVAPADPAAGKDLTHAVAILRHPLGKYSADHVPRVYVPALDAPQHPHPKPTTCRAIGDSEYLGRDCLADQARFVLPTDQQRLE